MATYFTTTLETAEFPDLGGPVLLRDAGVFYRLTAETLAWIDAAVQKARRAASAGKIDPKAAEEIEGRYGAIQEAWRLGGNSLPLTGIKGAQPALPPVPREWTAADYAALDAYHRDHPVCFEPDAAQEPLVLLRWPEHPDVPSLVMAKADADDWVAKMAAARESAAKRTEPPAAKTKAAKRGKKSAGLSFVGDGDGKSEGRSGGAEGY